MLNKWNKLKMIMNRLHKYLLEILVYLMWNNHINNTQLDVIILMEWNVILVKIYALGFGIRIPVTVIMIKKKKKKKI